MRAGVHLGVAGLVALFVLGLAACSSDDSPAPAGTGGSTGGSAGSAGAAGSQAGSGGIAGSGGAAGTGGVAGAAGSQAGAGGGGAAGSAGSAGAANGEFVTVVKGTLKSDVATSKTSHDAIAQGGETQAKAAGDLAHVPMLGTTHLGTTQDEFFAFDKWNSYDNMVAFYQDPQFQAAFGALFATPPLVESFVKSDLYGWGDLDSGKGATRYFIYVRGKLKGPTPADAKAAHDAVAKGGEAQVKAAGDVAHVPFVGKQDPLEFLNFDIWTSDAAIDAVYTDPSFQAAFGALFETPPTVAVYATSDWYSW